MIAKNPKYKPLYLSDKRYFLITGGRGSGKSFEVSTWANLLTYESNHRILFTRYTMTAAGLSIIPEFVEKIELLEVPHHFEVNRDAIRNKETGSDIIFKGIKTSSGNQTANLKSLQGVSTWILDEAEELEDETTFDKIDLSIRKKGVNNRVILVMNPATKEHWIWQRFFEGYTEYIDIEGEQVPISTHPDICHIHTTYLDNKDNLSDSYLNSIERIKQINLHKYKHVVLGGWLDKAEGVVFENWKEGAFDESLPFIFGADYGYVTDPSTLIKVAVDSKQMKLYVSECLYAQGLSTEQLASGYSDYCTKDDLIIADNAEPRLIGELWDKGFNINPCQKGKDSVRNGIAKMQDYEIIVTPESHNIKKELNNYAWHDKKSNTPQDNYNHAIDAIRYAFSDLVDDNDFFVA
jgi:phage terminase large subunit